MAGEEGGVGGVRGEGQVPARRDNWLPGQIIQLPSPPLEIPPRRCAAPLEDGFSQVQDPLVPRGEAATEKAMEG